VVAAVSSGTVACSSKTSNNTSANTSGVGTSAPGGQPQPGGTVSWGEFSSPAGLDPIIMTGSGSTGLIESEAVYDTLLRYNPQSKKYEARLALSATPNTDFTEWTVKLRPGVKFSDGTDFNAEAVIFSINRHRSGQPGAPPCAEIYACPRNSVSSAFPASYIKDIAALDDATVKITLKQPWASFQAALASELGLIPSETAIKKCNPTAPANQCPFNLAPVGAGPFVVTSFKTGEGITMARNPNYWGGQVYLDGLQFVNLLDGGGTKTLNALQANQLQGAFLRDPAAVAAGHDAGLAGFSNFSYGGAIFQMNMGAATAATANAKVRQVVATAVDPSVINQRAYGGKGQPSSQLLQPDFRWYPNVPGPKYDPVAAKQLVAEAKAAGWDGKIRVLANNSPAGANSGLAIEAMLQAVGVNVVLDTTKDIQGATALLVKHDFDTFFGGMAAGNDDSAAIAVAQNFQSGITSNRVGINDPALDQAIANLFKANTDADKTAAYKTIMTELNAQMPILPIAKIEEYLAWPAKLHGMQPGIKTTVYFDKAWIGK
jgi:peptide/nickel transport system substrate-binding protein